MVFVQMELEVAIQIAETFTTKAVKKFCVNLIKKVIKKDCELCKVKLAYKLTTCSLI